MFHIRLNMRGSPIAKKYCEGRLKSTLKRRLKEPEIAAREVVPASTLVRRRASDPAVRVAFRWGSVVAPAWPTRTLPGSEAVVR